MSKLYFRYGAMNSGKSTHLLQVAYNYEERNMNVLLIKSKTDTKGEDKLISRLGTSRKVDLLVTNDDDIYKLVLNIGLRKNISCILADEVQFMTAKQIDQLFEIAVKLNIPVICYGLRTDFKGEGFEGSTRLLLIAHSIEEMKTICSCGKKAIFNARKVNGEFVFDGEQVEIDNNDKIEYEALCGECYLKHKEKNQ